MKTEIRIFNRAGGLARIMFGSDAAAVCKVLRKVESMGFTWKAISDY